MKINFRHYTNQSGMTEDYHKVRDFFIKLRYAEFTYARWDWMTTHGSLDKSAVGRIGIWEDGNQIVGIATFDTQLGNAYLLALPEYNFVKKEMLAYAEQELTEDDMTKIIISDIDFKFQALVASQGYIANWDKESDAIFYVDETDTSYALPEGFHMTSMNETYNLYQYKRILWNGFNHEQNGEGKFRFLKENEKSAEEEMLRPHVDLNLKLAVVAPNGNFVSYCGMWYDAESDFAVVEPVATDPEYRNMGLGKAVVLEGIKRVEALGVKKIIVGSSQQFYYSIGFRPFATSSMWTKNINSGGERL